MIHDLLGRKKSPLPLVSWDPIRWHTNASRGRHRVHYSGASPSCVQPRQICSTPQASSSQQARLSLCVQRLAGTRISDFSFSFFSDGSSQTPRLPSKLKFYFDTDFKHINLQSSFPHVPSKYELAEQHSSPPRTAILRLTTSAV